MEERDRKRLLKNQESLVRDLRVEDVIHKLISKGILDHDDTEDINTAKTRKGKAGKLLEMLSHRGPNAYGVFKAALAEKYDFLVEKLDNTDVSEVNTHTRVATEHQEGTCAGGAGELSAGMRKLTVEPSGGATSCNKKRPPKSKTYKFRAYPAKPQHFTSCCMKQTQILLSSILFVFLYEQISKLHGRPFYKSVKKEKYFRIGAYSDML